MAETIGRGVDALLAAGTETVWGTEVAVTQLEPFTTENFTPRFETIVNPALIGVSGYAKGDQGSLIIEGAGWTSTFSYRPNNLVLANWFGSVTVPDPSDLNLLHYNILDSTFGTGLTVAIEKQVSVHTFTGYRVGQLTITGTAGQPLTYAVSGIARSHSRSSATNTHAVLTAVKTGNPPILNGLFINHEFRVAALGGTLNSAAIIKVQNFTLDANRNLAAAAVDAQERLEPIENDKRTATLRVTIPRYSSSNGADQFWDWHAANTSLFGTLTWTNGVYSKQLQLNKFCVTNPPANPVGGPAALTQEFEMTLYTDTEGDNDDPIFDFVPEFRLVENTL